MTGFRTRNLSRTPVDKKTEFCIIEPLGALMGHQAVVSSVEIGDTSDGIPLFPHRSAVDEDLDVRDWGAWLDTVLVYYTYQNANLITSSQASNNAWNDRIQRIGGNHYTRIACNPSLDARCTRGKVVKCDFEKLNLFFIQDSESVTELASI